MLLDDDKDNKKLMLVFYKTVRLPAFHQPGESSHSWDSLDVIGTLLWPIWNVKFEEREEKCVGKSLSDTRENPHWWPADFGIDRSISLSDHIGHILYADKLQILQVYIF